MGKKILVVVTSVERYPPDLVKRPTGLWLGECVHFVKKVEEAGYEVDYVSPMGGYTPIDPHSLEMADDTDWEWYGNKPFMARLGAVKTPAQVSAADYAAIYYTGGHGTVWDFPDNKELQALARSIYEAGGYVTSVCHGACALLNIALSDGASLISGKRVTGFSNEEEKQVQLDKYMPFLTEDELKARGATYEKASDAWAPFALSDARVITGQNPASGGAVAETLLKELGGK
ncbi:ThiJ/PfpI family protein [Tribonema minus]|uniref:ThiJ/PfpI family protein n=1 Tax=Tribonema minus TaxID=303371 RepID=A0A835Z5I0_9STRA|nr:ThiJ/PfpI family protein [Tribonema minus]